MVSSNIYDADIARSDYLTVRQVYTVSRSASLAI
nr:MAG TPA: hypothetical protein [Caudoviricetes sp.]